jgi:hypothetical protein
VNVVVRRNSDDGDVGVEVFRLILLHRCVVVVASVTFAAVALVVGVKFVSIVAVASS